MIDPRLKMEHLVGKKCRPSVEIRNGAGECISKDTICTIIRVVRGHGLTIQTEKCPHCGQSALIRGVSRVELTLLDEVKNEKNE